MGIAAKKRGRPRLTDEQIALRRGSSTKRQRKTERNRTTPKHVDLTVKKPLRLSLKRLEQLCKTALPNYDPWATKGVGDWFDATAARDAIKFIYEELVHVRGSHALTQFKLEDWQIAAVGNLFGWKRKDGSRRYRECLLYVPRKNGKSPLAACILLYGLFRDGEPGAEIYGAADRYKNAVHVFQHAQGMVKRNPKLMERCQIYKGQAKAIQLNDHADNLDDLSIYQLISSENSEGHGQNTHMAIVDELHLLPDRMLVDALMTATASEGRRQPLIMYLTTADFEREGSPCNDKHDYACKICRGEIEDRAFLPIVYGATTEDDWTDPAVWTAANPNLGVSVSRQYIERECKRAKEEPSYENTFKRLHLNIRTEQDTRWLPLELWDSCATKLADLSGRECYAGLDLAATKDTTALVLVFPDGSGGYDLIPHFWIPSENAQKRETRDQVPYIAWARDGMITMTPGDVTDYGFVRRDINEIGKRYKLREIAFDPWNATHLATQLGEEDGFEMVQFRQGFASISEPSKLLERLLLSGELRHSGHPVLRAQVGCVTVKEDPSGNIKPDKAKSTGRIDGVVAAVMALGRAMLVYDRPSVYNTRGFIQL